LVDVAEGVEFVSELHDAIFRDPLFHQRPRRVQPTIIHNTN